MTTHHEIVAGGRDGDFMTVRHLRLAGSQTEIGRGLAEAARETYGWRPLAADPRRARARREWFAKHWPQHAARLRGAASAAGVDPEAPVFLDPFTGVPEGSACSVTFCPPSLTEEGRGLVGRNYDFFLTSEAALFSMLSGEPVEDDAPPMASLPYVITSVPDDGPATTVLTMNELEGCMEGVNEHGLAVALLIADAENAGAPVEAGPQVGLGSGQLPRFVLDTCATAEEARLALLAAKHYDLGTPLHYLVADASGDAFVWERGAGGDEHIIDANSAALCVTNHLLHRHPDPGNLPEDNEETMETYQRYRALHRWNGKGELSGPALRAALDDVRYEARNAGGYPLRTLWRSVLDTGERTMSTHFYLGDNADGSARYSEELVFAAR
ncbi:C45 family autoproteolytic acyltransferase/hydolase [Prauserella flavalba]|uniref:C45 family autoproteolytic acyltransferase/hydolase n=1 Tax=Prauserella flavalba TaxID=1477506 RepID=UPI0036E3E2DD